MGERYWAWVAARLLVALGIIVWGASYMGAGSGEKEFQKTLDAMKQVHSFRMSYSANPSAYQHNDMLWEVDCARNIAHYQSHLVQSSANPPAEMKQDSLYAGGLQYERGSDGAWTQAKYNYQGGTVGGFCTNLAQGNDTNVLPEIATMIKRGIIQKGDKKTVNGVRCREWLVTLRGGLRGLEHDTVCVGLEDHLPYEMTVDWENSHTSISDYNTPIQFDLPAAAVQPASTATGTN